jgi:hypothetical protein
LGEDPADGRPLLAADDQALRTNDQITLDEVERIAIAEPMKPRETP